MTLSILKGSRITYTLNDETKTGTVFEIGRGQHAARTKGKLYYAFYRVAESPNDEILRENIIGHVSPAQLRKDVLLTLLDQDVLDNLQQSKAEVARAKERPTFKQTRRRFGATSKFTVARI